MCGVIVNSTPLIALGRIDRIVLLRDVFGCIAVPQAVCEEICKKTDRAAMLLKSKPEWIRVVSIRDERAKRWFPAALHDGEVEVMILAGEMGGVRVVIDDLPARRHAVRLFGKARVLGTLGVLIVAKKKGVIHAVAPLIDELRKAGIRYGEEAVQTALQMAGE
jgi:predicted nucleic acid-binding protein